MDTNTAKIIPTPANITYSCKIKFVMSTTLAHRPSSSQITTGSNNPFTLFTTMTPNFKNNG